MPTRLSDVAVAAAAALLLAACQPTSQPHAPADPDGPDGQHQPDRAVASSSNENSHATNEKDEEGSSEPKKEDLVLLEDGRELPRTHPEVVQAVDDRRQQRADAREERRVEGEKRRQQQQQLQDQQDDQANQLNETLASPDGQTRAVGRIACEHTQTRWCDLATHQLDALPVDWTAVGWAVVISEQVPDDWLGGLARSSENTLYVFPRDSWHDRQFVRVLMHELGHAVDHTWWDATDRDRYRHARGIPDDADHWAGGWPHDHSAVGEDFAEMFAVWTVGGDSKSPWPKPDTFDMFAEFLWPPGCDQCNYQPNVLNLP